MTIREEVTDILGVLVPEASGGYYSALQELSISGGLDNNIMIELVALILERLDKNEEDKQS